MVNVLSEMTESTLIQTTENNNTAGINKMEPPPVSPSPSDQQYSLKWNDFQSSILSSFRHLRDEEDFVDVTLACDTRSFTAHKVVLSACSPYFRKLLKANPCEHPIVILRDVRAEDVESLLRFMYNGEVHISHEQLTDFLKTAQLLQVRGLADVTGPHHSRSTSRVPISPSNNLNICTTTSSLHHHSPSLISSLSNPVLPPSAAAAIQEIKVSPTSTSLPWELPDDRSNHLTPPPQKRIKSVDLYRAQLGLSGDLDTNIVPKDIQPLLQSSHHHLRDIDINDRRCSRDRTLSNDRDRSRESNREDRSVDLRESLLGQALEGGPTIIEAAKSHPDLESLQAQSAGEESNSSDTAASDNGDIDGPNDGVNGSIDTHQRHFPGSFLGLQGISGLLPGPSGIHGSDNFVTRRQLEMRVRATDPRPCPKCGKIYRSAHTLRTHLEDKHTVCPGYRCVLCGTVAKSRNSLHSHMSRQHRGISTKDLPVLPMPSPFDPDLASRLLAKAGVKISPAELRARASPTSGTRRSDIKLELRGPGDDSNMDDLDDPEDLTIGNLHNNNNMTVGRYHESIMSFNHPNTTITRVRHGALTPKSSDGKDSLINANTPTSGQSLLDTYLQFITENSFGIGMSQEHAAAAFHAAKMAQINAIGHGLDKLPPGLLPSHLDLSKISNTNNSQNQHLSQISPQELSRIQTSGGATIEPATFKFLSTQSSIHGGVNNGTEIRRDHSEPMDLGMDSSTNNVNELRRSHSQSKKPVDAIAQSSGEDDAYSEDDAERNS